MLTYLQLDDKIPRHARARKAGHGRETKIKGETTMGLFLGV
jgi:hypothetical protein